jgi:putative heme-binding domain-containing protein
VNVNRLVPLVNDEDAKVRLELASTLGAYDSPEASAGLARLIVENGEDEYILAAAMSSLNTGNAATVLRGAMQLSDGSIDPKALELPSTLDLIGQAVAMGEKESLGHVIDLICSPKRETPTETQDDQSVQARFQALASVLDGLQSRGLAMNSLSSEASDRIDETIQQARTEISNHTAAQHTPAGDVRVAAVQLLGRDQRGRQEDFRLLQKLLVPQSPVVLQRAIVTHLSRRSESAIAEVLLSGWRSHSPELRGQILDVLATRGPWAESLCERLEAGTIAASELGAPVRQRLLDRSENATRWQNALAVKASPDRSEVLLQFRSALKLTGDAARGAAVFRKACINCHKVNDEGHEVGPQLASITDKTKESLLTSILDPNAAVDAKYFNYSVLTHDGRTFNGKLETETGSSITLVVAEGKRNTVLRRDIELLQASSQSLMPEGLEEGLKPQDVADLLQFVSEAFR